MFLTDSVLLLTHAKVFSPMRRVMIFFPLPHQRRLHSTTTVHNYDSPSPGPTWSAQITSHLPHKSLVIWQHDPYFRWVDLWWCVSWTDLPMTQRISALWLLAGQGASEQQDVWLWLVDHVMHPSLALLDPQISPFRLWHQMGLGDTLGKVLG